MAQNGTQKLTQHKHLTNGVTHEDKNCDGDQETDSVGRTCLIPTCSVDEVPLQFQEPSVFTFYRRPHQPWWYYLASFFQMHNECMNTWTHLIATILMIYKLIIFSQKIDFLNDPYTWAMLGGILSSIFLYCASTMAHCFQSKSEMTHYTCFMFDYAGVGLYGIGSVVAHFHYCTEDHLYPYIKDVFVPIGVLTSVSCCLCCSYAKVKYTRPYPTARKLWHIGGVMSLYFWLISPVYDQVFNCLLNGYRCDDTIPLHSWQLIWFMAAGFFYASEIPQRFYPGWCDFVGHSHQLFHVCIFMTTWNQYDGVFFDLKNNRDELMRRPTPTFMTTFGPIIFVLVLELIIIFVFRRKAKNNIVNRINKEE